MAEEHTWRLWLELETVDYKAQLVRDVVMPTIPLMGGVDSDRKPCGAFSLSGLYRPGLLRREYDIFDALTTIDGFYEPTYDVEQGLWHVIVSGHQLEVPWHVVAASLTYADWEVRTGPTPIPTTHPAARARVVPCAAHASAPAPAEPPAPDPETPVIDVLDERGVYMYGAAGMLDKIILSIASDARLNSDRVLRVKDLAGKSYADIFAIQGVGQGTVNCLVDAGLIPDEA